MKNQAPTVVLVLSTQRSGTTLFADYMGQMKNFGRPGEWILKQKRSSTGTLSPSDFFDVLKFGRESVSSPYAINIMANQLPDAAKEFFGRDEVPLEESPALQAQFLRSFSEVCGHPVIVRLKRLDKISQAISSLIHRKTGVAHIVRGQERFGMTRGKRLSRSEAIAVITPQEIVQTVRQFDKWESELDRVIELCDIPTFQMTYEDLDDNSTLAFTKLYDFLEFEQNDRELPKQSRLSKTSRAEETEIILKKLRQSLSAGSEMDSWRLLDTIRGSAGSKVLLETKAQMPTESDCQEVKPMEVSSLSGSSRKINYLTHLDLKLHKLLSDLPFTTVSFKRRFQEAAEKRARRIYSRK